MGHLNRFLKYLSQRYSFQKMILFIPLEVLLHVFEEGLTSRGGSFAIRTPAAEVLPFLIPMDLDTLLSGGPLFLAYIILALFSFLLSIHCYSSLEKRSRCTLILAFQAVLLANGLIPDILGSLLMFRYTPGLLTALFVIVPFSVIFFHQAILEGYEDRFKLCYLVLKSVFFYPLAMLLIHLASRIPGRLV